MSTPHHGPHARTVLVADCWTARNSAHRAVAGKLPGLLAASLHGRRGRRAPRHSSTAAALSTARRRIPPYPVSLGDLRSSILGDPVARRLPE